jgi:MFS family permease
MSGVSVRIVGYAIMFRVRTANPSMAELFAVQLIQGLGDGIVQTGAYVAATVNVPHRETAQMAALIVMIWMLGQSIGNAISGAIYTRTFREELAKQLGDRATPELIEALFNFYQLVGP